MVLKKKYLHSSSIDCVKTDLVIANRKKGKNISSVFTGA